MKRNKKILIGYASGIGAEDQRCAQGPELVINSPALRELRKNFSRIELLESQIDSKKAQAIPEIQRLSTLLAHETMNADFFIVLGGDHCSAIGTYSGAATKLKDEGKFGLLWLDAHLDSHTPNTSHSQNTHGMPVAALLGYGDPRLTNVASAQPKILPEHLCIIGARSFEQEEQDLLNKLNVKIYYMDEVKKRGLDIIFQEAYEIVNNGTAGFGISFDLDVLDPADAPGTGVQEPDGIRAKDMIAQLKKIPKQRLVGIDITEFNPAIDVESRTLDVIVETIRTFMAEIK